MKISDIPQDGIVTQQIQPNRKTPAVENGRPPQEGKNHLSSEDKVVLSFESKLMNKIHDVLAAIPDVRIDRVEALKKLIESGQYEVKSEDVAEKMLKDFLLELNK